MRILTWNLWWRFGPWEQRQHAISAVLRAARPDVVLLQEVWTESGRVFAERLAGDLGMELVFAPAGTPPHWRTFVDDDSLGVGNAVLTRWPVRESATRQLPSGAGPVEDRVALYALVDAPQATVPVFTTHLHSAPAGSAVRCAQVRALAEFVAERGLGHGYPPLTGGDFNADPDSDEVRLFSGMRTAPAVPGVVMVDLWRYAAADEPWATWSADNPYIRHPGDVDARIDYLFAGVAASDPRPFRLRSIELAGAGGVDGVWPSDHLAIVADLAMPGDEGFGS